MKTNILIIEDDRHIQNLLEFNFKRAGFDVLIASDGEEGLCLAKENHPNLIILDWMLPFLSGIELLQQFRRIEPLMETPILMLTAKSEEGDKLRGLDLGADDYVVKPFSPAELIARSKALLRRASKIGVERLKCCDLEMNTVTKKVTRAGKNIKLGPTEFNLLALLLRNQGRVFSREQLLDQVWGHGVYVESRTVDVHIRRLRKAINIMNSEDLIRTVRSMGYSLEKPPH